VLQASEMSESMYRMFDFQTCGHFVVHLIG
jgi:hypothetical protein